VAQDSRQLGASGPPRRYALGCRAERAAGWQSRRQQPQLAPRGVLTRGRRRRRTGRCSVYAVSRLQPPVSECMSTGQRSKLKAQTSGGGSRSPGLPSRDARAAAARDLHFWFTVKGVLMGSPARPPSANSQLFLRPPGPAKPLAARRSSAHVCSLLPLTREKHPFFLNV
jgi:hypothetical protein